MRKHFLVALMALTGAILSCDTCLGNEASSLFSIHLVREDNEIVNIKLYKKVSGNQESLFVVSEPILDETSVECVEIRFRKFYTPEMIELINSDPIAKAQILELEKKGLTKDEPELYIKFDNKAKALLAKVTTNNIGKRLAIIVDNKVVVAPIIREPLEDGDAVINMNKEDMERFVAKYNRARNNADKCSPNRKMHRAKRLPGDLPGR